MKLFDQVHLACRATHYSPRTEEAYTRWIERFLVDSGTQRSFRRRCEGNSYYVPGTHPALKQENTKNEDLTRRSREPHPRQDQSTSTGAFPSPCESNGRPCFDSTHAITIHAPAAEVWKWLVQIGQGRGGYYSYELLENIIGCKIHNAETVVPELQDLEVGDSIPMHPSMGSPYKVAVIEPNSTLILELRADVQTGETFAPSDKLPEKYQNQSWLFLLDEGNDGTTRIISRSRNDWNKSLGNTIFYGIFGPLTMEMDRKMLLGIRKRAEASQSSISPS